jgi:hypothetical protein
MYSVYVYLERKRTKYWHCVPLQSLAYALLNIYIELLSETGWQKGGVLPSAGRTRGANGADPYRTAPSVYEDMQSREAAREEAKRIWRAITAAGTGADHPSRMTLIHAITCRERRTVVAFLQLCHVPLSFPYLQALSAFDT